MEIINIISDLPMNGTYYPRTAPPTVVVVHHSATRTDVTPRQIAEYQIGPPDNFPGIAYHFLVYADGKVYQTNDTMTMSYHAGDGTNSPLNTNRTGIGICLVGDFTYATPPEAQIAATRELIAFLGLPFIPHRDAYNTTTSCPGSAWEYWSASLRTVEDDKMTALSVQFQTYPDWAKDFALQYMTMERGGWIMALNPPVPDMFPQSYLLGRSMWHPDGYASCDDWETYIKNRGAQGGAEYFNFNLSYYQQRRGIVSAWQFINEPIIWSDADARNYRDALNTWNTLMHNNGFKTIGGAWARGNPQLRIVDPGCNYLAIMAPALSKCDYQSYHAYWRGRFSPTDVWEALRYRLIGDELVSLGYPRPIWFITECGDDNGGGRTDGWRDDPAYAGDWPLYLGDLKAITAEFTKDKVKAAFIFLCGAYTMWRSFELDQPQAEDVGQHNIGYVPNPMEELLEWAEGIVIPYNQDAALAKYIDAKGWIPQSQEMAYKDGTPVQWGRHKGTNQRTLIAWQAGRVIEVTTVDN